MASHDDGHNLGLSSRGCDFIDVVALKRPLTMLHNSKDSNSLFFRFVLMVRDMKVYAQRRNKVKCLVRLYRGSTSKADTLIYLLQKITDLRFSNA